MIEILKRAESYLYETYFKYSNSIYYISRSFEILSVLVSLRGTSVEHCSMVCEVPGSNPGGGRCLEKTFPSSKNDFSPYLQDFSRPLPNPHSSENSSKKVRKRFVGQGKINFMKLNSIINKLKHSLTQIYHIFRNFLLIPDF